MMKQGVNPKGVREAATEMMKLVKCGKIRQHILGNSSIKKHGAMEQIERQQYSEFVRTRLCYDILEMIGCEVHD